MRRPAFWLALAVLPVLAAAPAAGQADFTRYVAFGDSLTAGFYAGSLLNDVQANSYPALINRQATDGAAGFEQPRVTHPGIPSVLELRSLSPLVIAPKGGQGSPANLNLPRPYNNMAVPGADVHDLVATTTDNGGLHDLILRQQGFTQLQQGLSLRPTFATVWIGNNDVLGAAVSGRVIEGVTLTPVSSFEPEFRFAVGAIATSGARLAIATIPDVTAIPFVNTLSRFIVNPATSQPVLVNGQPVPLIGPDGLVGAGDFVLLSAAAELAQGRGIPAALGGSGLPLSDAAVLNAGEAATIRARVEAFNSIIRSEAQQRGAALLEVAPLLTQLRTTGFNFGGVTVSGAFLTGGFFSYDGVHPTDTGYAIVANAFIAAINERFDVDIPPVDLFPFLFGPPIGGGAPVAPSDLSAGVGFTRAADASLRFALGIPSDAEIDRLVAERAQPAKPPRRHRRNRRGTGG